MAVTGIILAGGKNSRMGTNKALLKLGGQTFIERAAAGLGKFCSEVIVVANDPKPYSRLAVRVVPDLIPGKGPLAGIHAGLNTAANQHSFIVACDMPFLHWPLGEYMAARALGFDVLIPRLGEYIQPLHAVYSKTCIGPIEDCLRRDIFKIAAFYPKVKVGYLDYAQLSGFGNVERIFFNVNTPGDFEQAREVGRSGKDEN